MELIAIDDHLTAIDHDLLDLPGVGATYVVRGEEIALIETGTSPTVPATLAGLERLGISRDAVGHILCTHIHVDHAGGAGYLAAELPRAMVYINSAMHAHLADPSRLLSSSRRAIGERAWPLHGDMLPVPLERLRPSENLRLDLGRDVILEALATPGHSPDHTSYWDRYSGGMFVGDAAGLVMDYHDLLFPVTPAPTYNLEDQRNTIAMLRQQAITRLYVTHFGPHDNVADILRRSHEKLEELVDLVDRAMEQDEVDVAAVNRAWLPYDYSRPGGIIAECWGEMSVVGLLRYEKKRRETAA